jgi:hypothetical protein
MREKGSTIPRLEAAIVLPHLIVNLHKEHDFAAFFRYTGGERRDARRLQDAPGLRGTHKEKGTRMILARIVLPLLALESFTLSGVLLATMGTLFLAYDLLGRENGPLRWFTLVLTGGLVSALVFVPVAILDAVLGGVATDGFNLFIILTLILFGGLMGLYTVILVDFSPSDTRPAFFSWKGGLLGLALALLFWFAGHTLGVLVGLALDIPALSLGLACALLMSTWQRLSWDPAQAVETPHGLKPAQARPPVFSPQGGVRGLLLSYLLGVAFFFAVNRDVIASLLEGVPLALTGGVIGGTWRFINWEPAHPTPHLFSRKGFWTGLVAGFVPWLGWGLALSYADLPKYTGLLKGLEYMRFLFYVLFIVGISALANAVAGSIARYALWRANRLPHRSLGAFGLVLIVIAFALQAVQPAIDILNQMK